MTFKIYFEIKEEIELEDSLDSEIKQIIIADITDGIIDTLIEQGYKIQLKKIERNT